MITFTHNNYTPQKPSISELLKHKTAAYLGYYEDTVKCNKRISNITELSNITQKDETYPRETL